MLSFTKKCVLNCYDNFFILCKNNLEIIGRIITLTDVFIPQKVVCNICYYSTSNKKGYNKHLDSINIQYLQIPSQILGDLKFLATN